VKAAGPNASDLDMRIDKQREPASWIGPGRTRCGYASRLELSSD